MPNDYIAGGRTTDSALAETCVPGNCLMYIAPAGGGVWRTKERARADNGVDLPRRPARHQRHGHGQIDPNDPTGKTI